MSVLLFFPALISLLGIVTGWRPVKPPAMPEATYSIPQLTFTVAYKARDAIARDIAAGGTR